MALEKSASPTVLIVDDEPLIRWALVETLVRHGCTAVEAGSANEAIEQLARGLMPDVILLDYRLPGSLGLTLLETLKQLVPSAAVIMMTAFAAPTLQADALRLGAYRLVIKPLDMSDVSPLVQEAYEARL